jgi:hypothetical protein
MKVAAIISNVILFGFTCLVIVTDGPAHETGYIIFSFLLLLVPVVNVLVFFRFFMSRILKIAAVVSNFVLLGFAVWAIVSQYPHPEEEGVVAYTILVVLTPIFSMVALSRGRGLHGRPAADQ